jgi:hypothetical protein
MENVVIESYLIRVGFEISQPELNKFKGALKEAGTAAEHHTSGIIRQFVNGTNLSGAEITKRTSDGITEAMKKHKRQELVNAQGVFA